jgi:hypothetical protein
MLATSTLSDLLGQPITDVTQQPLTTEFGRSGSRILLLNTNQGHGPRLVLKLVSQAWDWLMRTTEDTRCRSVTLWQYGILEQLPPEVAHGVIACAHNGDGWGILLEYVGDMMVPFDPFTQAENQFFLNAMASFHARFWQQESIKNPELGLCQLRHTYQLFAPRVALPEIEGDNNIPRRVIEGWELAHQELPVEVMTILDPLLDDPSPLVRALERYPYTLIHGDWRHANQACAPGVPQLFMLDWQLAVVGPPAVEIGRYLITNSPLLPGSKEDTIEKYRQMLAAKLGERYADEWWQPQLALGLLGGFLQDGWSVVLKATTWHVGEKHRAHWQADLPWWSERVRAGAQWL